VNWYRSGGRELAEDGMRYRWMKAHKGDWYAWAMRTAGTNNLDAAIDVARWNRSFESERREVYVKRDEIVAARAKGGK
jgi:hypothetical protein